MHPLDNPIWAALTTRRSEFAQASGLARRFHPEVTSLAGFAEPTEAAYASLASLSADGAPAALFLRTPQQPPLGWQIIDSLPLRQMVLVEPGRVAQAAPQAEELSELTESDAVEMLALARLTQPGPFGMRTRELGNYIGIRREGKIVAMAGERLRVDAYTEISAVCTHPAYLGRGFAAKLMTELAHRIRARGETPILHVRGSNTRAIALYERLGFETRAHLHCLVLRSEQKEMEAAGAAHPRAQNSSAK
jgi:ribosomal protein S18 acetylase RimI-like enzyme